MVRTLVFLFLIAGGSCLVGAPPPVRELEHSLPTASLPASGEETIFLGCGLSDEDVITVTTSFAASGHAGTLLIDSANSATQLKAFLARARPQRVIPVGCLEETKKDFENRLGVSTEPALEWSDGLPLPLWRALFSRVPRVVVCPREPRRTLLQAACLAGVAGAPLVVVHREPGEGATLHRQLVAWGTTELFAIAERSHPLPARLHGLPGVRIIHLVGEQEVSDYYLRLQLKEGPIRSLVVANPADVRDGRGGMSALAPWLALQKRAALLLTNNAGDDTRTLVDRALKRSALRHAEFLILVADPKAIPPERRPNPVPGKDPFIEMEPETPTGSEPFSLATGRLFHKDAGLLLLMLARQRLFARGSALPACQARPLKALVVSNPAGGLPLLETFSRNTAKELRNRGYQTASLFGDRVTKEEVRRLLPEQDIFLWEGHHSTMTRDYGLPDWPEPLQPSLVFLQSCLALCEPEALPLLERGAIGLIGSSTRTYSASGGACSLAFFNALLYEKQTLGGSLRQAKNFLLAYALLKEKRIGPAAKLSGANLRSAWAFTLWGDPTLELPGPQLPENTLPVVHHEVRGNTIILSQPRQAYQPVAVSPYRSQMLPGARLAGLVQRDSASEQRRLAALLFAEVHLPKAPPGKVPSLHSRLPADRYVFCWDPRRHCGYLLATPRAIDRGELRFQVHWE
jgi:hypothetical protein